MSQTNRVLEPFKVLDIQQWRNQQRNRKADLPLQDRFLNAQEVADKLGVHRTTVYRWRNNGILPLSQRKGRTVRWSEQAIEQWWHNAPKEMGK
ncbi:helix-turn-helix domain-containing protein [uncultured Thiothrix sp.]|uniref:helix-turn-helix transcriptional regulator n=1 Tax=uncultured Thiothrix sp. TaxID=223185 RepID=UPI00262CA8C6|nr:helix-turn-helix domain-containing protein [uncultured Thiothrix sp.]HMT94915.1 helix-turn-helix domain-containing protein [Thiolinea sp.]